MMAIINDHDDVLFNLNDVVFLSFCQSWNCKVFFFVYLKRIDWNWLFFMGSTQKENITLQQNYLPANIKHPPTLPPSFDTF